MLRDIGRAVATPLFQLYGATEAGVLSWNASTGGCIQRAPQSHRSRAVAGNAPLARVLVTTLGRPWMPLLRYDVGDVVRVAETRDCACGLMSDGPVLERVEGRQSDCVAVNGETVTPLMLDDAIHLALGAAATNRTMATRGRHAARRDPASREERGACGRSGEPVARATDSRRARERRRAGSVRQVPAGQELMRSAGFPLLERGYDGAPFIYLDSASTTPKPRGVIDAVVRYYETVGANVHRGTHPIAEAATEAYENARHRVAALIGAQPAEIVFTRNATDSFNLLARALRLTAEDEIVAPPSITATTCRGRVFAPS